MIVGDQQRVIEFLGSAAAHGSQAVEVIDTHASVVFLAGARAWKLKRAVRYDYLDFSTPERRKAMCEAELRVNRRLAPTLYRRVVPVTRGDDGALALDGAGRAVDWVIEMARFDQDELFDRLAARHALDLDLMAPLAAAIARLHEGAERRHDHGGSAGMAWVVEGNAAAFAAQPPGVLDAATSEALTREALEGIRRHRVRLDGRRGAGFVRQCHGDLHLRNIVRLGGVPTLFDAVEFNDEIACVDVMYDLAFLLMDLDRRGLRTHAHAVLDAYLSETGDVEALALLPLFLSCRAAVRAKTSAAAASLANEPARRQALVTSAGEYLAMACRLLHPPVARLVAIGGLSGSGKSTLARALAPSLGAVPGAVVIRSDEVRKRLCGAGPLDRLGAEGYVPELTERVYASAIGRAADVVRTGHSSIVDAVFAREGDRDAVEAAAAQAGVPFGGLWMEAPPDVLLRRVEGRGADCSDADAAVVRRQLAQPIGPLRWHRIDSTIERDRLVRDASRALGP